MSSIVPITIGVPQGSILGTLMFVIYINSFPSEFNNSQCKIHMYADDTILLFRGRSVNELQNDMQSGLQRAEEWFTKHKLTLDLKKISLCY